MEQINDSNNGYCLPCTKHSPKHITCTITHLILTVTIDEVGIVIIPIVQMKKRKQKEVAPGFTASVRATIGNQATRIQRPSAKPLSNTWLEVKKCVSCSQFCHAGYMTLDRLPNFPGSLSNARVTLDL